MHPHPKYKSNIQGIWQDAEKNHKLCGKSRAYYEEDLVDYTVKIVNYTVVLEQMTNKNPEVNYAEKNSKLRGRLNNYKTVPKGIFSACFMTKQDGDQSHNILKQNGATMFFPQHPSIFSNTLLSTLLYS